MVAIRMVKTIMLILFGLDVSNRDLPVDAIKRVAIKVLAWCA